MVLSSAAKSFYDYLDLVSAVEFCLMKQGYEGVFQVASFHPDYVFEDADIDDAANYTNRSPYPVLHILREDKLEEAKLPKNGKIKCATYR